MSAAAEEPVTADGVGSVDFERAVQRHIRLLRGLARGTGRADADDLLQEALLRAYVRRADFASEQHLVNFVARVVRGLACDDRRSWYRRHVTLPGDVTDAVAELAPDPADIVVRREAHGRLLAALAALPRLQRDLLWQHVVDGVPYAELARASGRPLPTVRALAHRARQAARRWLAESGLPALLPATLGRARTVTQRVLGGPRADDVVAAVLVVLGALVASLPGNVSGSRSVPPPAAVRSAGESAASTRLGAATAGLPVLAGQPTLAPTPSGSAGSPLATVPPRRPDPSPDRPPVPTLSYDGIDLGTFSGTFDNTCRTVRGGRYVHPESGAGLDRYECTLTARSEHCTLARPPRLDPCSATLPSLYFAGHASAVRDNVHLCNTTDVPYDGALVVTDGDGVAWNIRVRVSVVAGTFAVVGGGHHGGYYVILDARVPMLCDVDATDRPGFVGILRLMRKRV